MNRPSPRFEVLGLAAALAFGGSCTPNNSVKPGAPVLTEMVIVDNGTPYMITPSTPACPAAVTEGAVCNAMTDGPCQVIGSSEGGTASLPNWCRCRGASPCQEFVPGANPSSWNCGPFAPTTPLIAVFDRLLDTAPFTSDGGPLTNVASVVAPVGSLSTMDAAYMPNGAPEFDDAGNLKTLLFPLYECINVLSGTGTVFNDDGPNLAMAPNPMYPTGQTVTVKLDGTNVRAKDGRTPFSSAGTLLDGMLTFQTVAFDVASITVPMAPPMDAAAPAGDGGADAAATPVPVPPGMMPVTITFTAPVDLTKDVVDIKILVGPAGATTELPIVLMQPDGGAADNVVAASPTPTTVTLTPIAEWPTGTTITVEVLSTATDLLGDQLPAVRTGSFVTGS